MSPELTRLVELLDQMPAIAKAVNAFDSPKAQAIALKGLLGAADLGQSVPPARASVGKTGSATAKAPATNSKSKAKAPAKKGRAGSRNGIDKETQLRPEGKQAFIDFAKEKQPTSQHQKGVVAVYYLSEVAGEDNVSVEMVNACFKAAAWRLPADSSNSLQVAASKEGWLDTGDMDALKVTSLGTNLVEHDLPKKK